LNDDGPYVVVFDPLDGSRNIDASIPTGSIFGIYRKLEGTDAFPSEQKAELNVLQRGDRLVAAMYALYSSATILCLSLGSGTHAFTLDHSTGDFVLTNPNLCIPERGTKTFLHFCGLFFILSRCLSWKYNKKPHPLKKKSDFVALEMEVDGGNKPWILRSFLS
jgi:hypothetical protein